jgi:hypothetical protein
LPPSPSRMDPDHQRPPRRRRRCVGPQPPSPANLNGRSGPALRSRRSLSGPGWPSGWAWRLQRVTVTEDHDEGPAALSQAGQRAAGPRPQAVPVPGAERNRPAGPRRVPPSGRDGSCKTPSRPGSATAGATATGEGGRAGRAEAGPKRRTRRPALGLGRGRDRYVDPRVRVRVAGPGCYYSRAAAAAAARGRRFHP